MQRSGNLHQPGKQVWGDVTHVVHAIEGWEVVAQYKGSSAKSVHTVEANGAGSERVYRCTCQGFRIHKRGYCKHTERAKEEGL